MMSHAATDPHNIPFSPRPETISRPSVFVPELATDCHFHIFGPSGQYPFATPRMYNPQEASVADYQSMAATVGIQRMVVVQASVYGVDNRCLLDSIQQLGSDRTRGIAVINLQTPEADLEKMAEAGVRGIRFNAISGGTDLTQLTQLAARIEKFGWHIQLWVNGVQLPDLEARLMDLPVEIAIDHIGQVSPSTGVSSNEFKTLTRLLESGRAWVKLSGYRPSEQVYPHDDVFQMITSLISTAPDKCLWGSDWPHPLLGTKQMPDVGKLMDLLATWAGSAAQLQRILVQNPARLYGFEPSNTSS
ncbi:amidohydrolase family protein [Pseudomonas fluorescens]|uniref:amidohydrolase family protein n=1 Tax=Pseudomonas fluorescens TaxID=294 RepID=UPI003F990406